jgi:hypothetical protein
MVNLALKISVLGTLIIAYALVHLGSKFIVEQGFGLFAIAILLAIAAVSAYREP